MSRVSLAIFVALCLTACSMLPKGEDKTDKWSDTEFYQNAKAELNDGNYAEAIKYYEQIEIRYPYSKFAQQSMLDLAYAYYKNSEQESALTTLDRFIKLYPNHASADYAYYLRALCNFNDDLGLLNKFAGQDPTERDPKATQDAFEAFKEVATRFPSSKYAEDARLRMSYIVNALAAHEVHAARYYLKRGAYVAAANRAQYALKEYPQAPANEEGLLVMVKAYDALGMTDLRDDAERVIKLNFPNSKYLTGDVPKNKRWWQIWNE